MNRWLAYTVTFGAGAVQVVVAIVLSRVAFQNLSESDLKVWFVMMAAMPFVSLFELGANIVLPHRFANVSFNPKAVTALIASFMAAVIVILVGVLLLSGAACFVSVHVELIRPSLAYVLTALGVAATLRVVGNVLHGMLYALGDNNTEKTFRIATAFVMAATGIAGLKFGFGIYSMPMALAAAALTSIALCSARLISRWQVHPLQIASFHWQGMKEMLASSSRYVAIALPGQLVFNATPFIIATQLPTSFSISYGLTQQLIAGISMAVSLPITISAPRLAAQYKESVEKAAGTLIKITQNTALIAACCLLIVGLNRFEILSIWLGRPVQIDSTFIVIYFIVMFIEWQQTALTTATMVTGNFRFVLVTLASAAIVLTTMPFFIKSFGFAGVPLAILTAQTLTCHPHNYLLALRTYRIDLRSYLNTLWLPAAAACIVALSYFTLNQIDIIGIWLLAGTLLIGMLTVSVFSKNIAH